MSVSVYAYGLKISDEFNPKNVLTCIAGLFHVFDLDLTAQILIFPCQTFSIYQTGLTWKDQNLSRKVEVKYMNEPL